jgi:stage III sporulation protein SpoIIIAA|tara:strand:+ start:1536 stop:2528 length:993 start_codon:yes stop_codon:yes gene_type:complete
MIVCEDLISLISIFPDFVQIPLKSYSTNSKLMEIVFDIGKYPEARFTSGVVILAPRIICRQDMHYVLKRITAFNDKNRAGINKTLHRISCLKNREDQIIGLTCRVGRSIIGSTNKIRDILLHDKSILILGKPGSGKTTIIREIARIFSNELEKRVVIVDTSNEIAGDNDVPHVAVGRARRLQVKKFDLQHQVLIEAVENHMPEVIIIDEISTETETLSARTIAERGVQLIATAHGNSLVNLVKNPILVNLIGGIQSVTLSDQSAKLRNTKKSVLERQFAATFDVIIEISSSDSWIIYDKVEEAVDLILNGENTNGQARLDLMTHLEINYP